MSELFIFELEVTNKKIGVAQVFIAGKRCEDVVGVGMWVGVGVVNK